MTLDGEVDELSGIDQMLRLKVVSGPLTSLFKLDAEKISAISEDAIADRSDKLAIAIIYSDISAGYDRIFKLETNSGKGNILQIGNAAALHARTIAPDHLDQVRAEKTRIDSPFLNILHTCLIGSLR